MMKQVMYLGEFVAVIAVLGLAICWYLRPAARASRKHKRELKLWRAAQYPKDEHARHVGVGSD